MVDRAGSCPGVELSGGARLLLEAVMVGTAAWYDEDCAAARLTKAAEAVFAAGCCAEGA